MSIAHVVSVSTGKDSGATAILALETMPRESLRFISCDTGNEHDNFLSYIAYMERHLGIKIDVLRADLSQQVIRFRDYVRDHWPRKGEGTRWTGSSLPRSRRRARAPTGCASDSRILQHREPGVDSGTLGGSAPRSLQH